MRTKRGHWPDEPDRLVGTWVDGNEYGSDLEYVVRRDRKGFKVRAVDCFDGEQGKVYEICYDPDEATLSFEVRWRSTGRLLSVRLQPISPNRVSYTYSYTESQMWFRKGTEGVCGAKPSGIRRKQGREPAHGE